MRIVPNGLAIVYEDGLRRFVLYAGQLGQSVADRARLLHDDQDVPERDTGFGLQLLFKLGEGARADGTSVAVLEKEHGLLMRSL